MSEVNGPQKPVAMNYGGNSNRQKDVAVAPERVKIEKVIEGRAVERKKGIGRKLKDHFQGENDMQSIGSYIFWDVIIPKVRDLAFDAINEGANRAFYGDTSPRRTSSNGGRVVSRPTAYNRIYDTPSAARTVSQRPQTQTASIQDILIPSLGEAEKVLDTLIEYVEKYGFVSVLDLYDAVGITNGEFTDDKHGWDDLRTARPIRTRDGYILDLPPTKQRE